MPLEFLQKDGRTKTNIVQLAACTDGRIDQISTKKLLNNLNM